MQLAPIRPSTAPRSLAAPDAPAAPVVPALEAALGSPAGNLFHGYSRELSTVPGVQKFFYTSAEPNRLELEFDDVWNARLAAGLFESDPGGVHLAMQVGGEEITPEEHGPASQAAAQLRALAAMPGVWDVQFDGRSPSISPTVTVRTTTPEVAARLDAIVRDRLDCGLTPGGALRYMHLKLVPGVST